VKNTIPKVYIYSACSTCQKALKFLKLAHIEFESIAIRETPPSVSELNLAKHHIGELKKLFNVSGKDYRDGNWKEKLEKISEGDAIKELSHNGNLIKRPFVIFKGKAMVGFKEDEWKDFFKK
jgi:arsenate reductase